MVTRKESRGFFMFPFLVPQIPASHYPPTTHPVGAVVPISMEE